ncbi:class I SAM-dependent methyltransferase [Phenylobacterium sp.]|uniref:class I SAM-dependent methyltransferase n=1 Tax=Phenylobacterium sp. TaxID=1871053 RepID=UPI0035AF9280
MSLRNRLIAQIRAGGPISVAQYMTACLHDPKAGYYATRPALGEAGDFITAPMVSQMFGELIGLWLAQTWIDMGRPARVRLVELGPGDGTLMSDALRAARAAPGFLEAADLWLVETSAPLQAAQARRLAEAPAAPRWAGSLQEVPEGAPLLLVANELLDCLPARQYVRTEKGWAERLVGLDEAGELSFGLGALSATADRRPDMGGAEDAPPGAVLEQSPAQAAFGSEIGARVAQDGGAALLIDYGRIETEFGDTLQALRGHRKESPLASPGEADLTIHVDFPAVLAAARAEGAAAAILTQGAFLFRLGIAQRAQALAAARPDQAERIGRQLERLVAEDQMGQLFKAACIHSPGLVPPAFEDDA